MPDPIQAADLSTPGADARNPWSVRDTQVQYDNPWIRVREDRVLRPDGRPGIYGVVEFKHIATGVVALREDGRIPLVGQWRYPLDRYSWEIPEGGAAAGEDPLEAARRELLEETGLTATNWEPLVVSHLSNCVTNEEARVYLATGLREGPARPDGDEVLQVRWVPLEEALTMVIDGRITDAVSQLGIMAAMRRRRR